MRDVTRPWAIDNRAFVEFNVNEFTHTLEKMKPYRDHCLFVSAPDVVGSARRTLEVFEHWKSRLAGWKIALVCQDGQEHLPIPWDQIDAVFIGGTTNWKGSHHVTHIVKAAQLLNKWVHIGRINTPARFEHFLQLGADSCDGSGVSQYTWMREAIANRHDQASLELHHEPVFGHP